MIGKICVRLILLKTKRMPAHPIPLLATGIVCENRGMEEYDDCVELIFMGDERQAIDFLQGDPYRNIWTISTLKRYGAFNLGLPEQGSFYGYFDDSDGLAGLLYCNNLGCWRFHAASEDVLAALMRAAISDERRPISITGDPAVLEGALVMEKRSLTVLERGVGGRLRIEKRRLYAGARRHGPYRSRRRPGRDGRVGEGPADPPPGPGGGQFIPARRVLELAKKGRAAVLSDGRRLAAKAELEVEIDRCSQLSGVFTRPEARGRGAATAVCSLICGLALAEGREVCLETQADNQAALALYAGIGFRKHGDSLIARFEES